MEPSPKTSRGGHPVLAILVLSIGGICFVSAWLGAAVHSASRAGWMAPVAAAVAIALLRLGWSSRGTRGRYFALVATFAYVLVGEWLVACMPIGAAMGQSPVEAAHRVGVDFGWMLVQLGNRPLDWFWLVLALAVAWRFGR